MIARRHLRLVGPDERAPAAPAAIEKGITFDRRGDGYAVGWFRAGEPTINIGTVRRVGRVWVATAPTTCALIGRAATRLDAARRLVAHGGYG